MRDPPVNSAEKKKEQKRGSRERERERKEEEEAAVGVVSVSTCWKNSVAQSRHGAMFHRRIDADEVSAGNRNVSPDA